MCQHFFLRKPLIIAVLAVLWACFLLNLGLMAFERGGNFIFLFGAPMLTLVIWGTYSKGVKTLVKEDAQLSSGAPIEVTVTVTESGVKSSSSVGSDRSFGFSAIEQVSQTKNLYVLRVDTGFFCVLPKDSFTVGTAEGLLAFLREAGVKIK